MTAQAADTTSNYDLAFDFNRFLKRRWTLGAQISAEANEELGLDLRLSLGLLGSRILIETNKTILDAVLGISGTREDYATSDSTSYNLEIPIGLYYTRFTFHDPKSSIEIDGQVYPSLTTHGRYRGNANISLNYEIAHNLYLVLGYYYQYDSLPPEGSSKDDSRMNTSISWTFG
ncbi:DUF481 domain-containing protein [Candidatus Eisenbacteria bacterium]|uniref:DUF481 domain-containing protein n=1 Tax=Eiseniibacteriota bacterium TaxID=2212470 RepID=A0ABV6YQ34_UNCEI